MKNYAKIASILCAIALVCAAILAGINMLTSQVIAANDVKTQENTIKTICKTANILYTDSVKVDVNEANGFKSNTVTADGAKYTATITAVYDVKHGSDVVCSIYTVTGKNDYGNITLMVEVEKSAAGKYVVGDVEFIENGQSFGSTVNAFLKSAYISSVDESKFEGGAVTEVAPASEKLDAASISSLSVSCGATYGASLVRDLTAATIKAATEREAK